ncbi:hypothetical protein Hanom_Chr11g01063621 [Helianthus anomalus]
MVISIQYSTYDVGKWYSLSLSIKKKENKPRKIGGGLISRRVLWGIGRVVI